MAYTTIDDPTDYFNTVLYTGNNSTNAITGVGHQPDWVWIKRRDSGSDHILFDSVRGVQKGLFSSRDNAEATEGGTRGLNAFNSDGFTLGAEVQDIAGSCNVSSGSYVSWNWKAGGSASSNSNGSITSSVSANTTAGFSIVSYSGNGTSGATVGHGLGVVPKMIIVKRRDSTRNWTVYHQENGNTHGLILNASDAKVDSDSYWNDTTPSSTVFTLGNGSNVNNGSGTYIAYCFAEKKGYSKFGSYTGNGNADGTFIYTGFKPAFLIIKQTDFGNSWRMYDNKRSTFNVVTKELYPNTNDAEATTDKMDFVSNGFKYRTSSTNANGSGSPYIFMAFAESPFVNSNGVPNNAR